MGYEPVWGFAAGPVLNYAGTEPVALESPCPYAQWETNFYPTPNYWETVSSGDGYAQVVSLQGFPIFTYLTMRLIAVENKSKIRLTLTKSANANSGNFQGRLYVGASSSDVFTIASPAQVGAPSSIEIDVPWYRFKIDGSMNGVSGVSGDYSVRLDVEFIT